MQEPLLVADDVIPDRELSGSAEDRFEHLAISSRVAELLAASEPPVSIGVFGPWGTGKSSFFESAVGPDRSETTLLGEALGSCSKIPSS